MVSYWERRAEETRRRRLAQAMGVPPSGLMSEDERAQERLREQFPADALFAESGTGVVRTSTPEEQAQTRADIRSFIFGPERRSVFGGEAGLTERFVRDWGLSEQEFRLAGQSAREGRVLPAVGWAGVGLAGAVPFVGDVAQGAARAGRAVERASDVARAGESAADVGRAVPAGREFEIYENPVEGIEEFFVEGFDVPRYNELNNDGIGQTQFQRKAFDFEISIQNPEFGAPLNEQFNRIGAAYNSLSDYQQSIGRLASPVNNDVAALANWADLGHQPIQNYLRMGYIPSADATKAIFRPYYDTDFIYNIRIGKDTQGLNDAEVAQKLEQNVFNSISRLDNAMELHRSHPDFISYRGVENSSILKNFGEDFYNIAAGIEGNPESLVGLSWQDKAYTATSLSPTKARFFSRNDGVIFKYYIPDGVGSIPVNGYLDPQSPTFTLEYEVLLERNLNFEIIGVTTNASQYEAGIARGVGPASPPPVIHVRITP